jgi:hypothetical protein
MGKYLNVLLKMNFLLMENKANATQGVVVANSQWEMLN